MNFRKKWKHFWTLNRHHAEGFTLVELIVVIAVLAILAGVGIPVYSGYVEKADKAADEAVLYEINQAFRAACIENLYDVYNVQDADAEIVSGTVVVSNVKVNDAINDAIATDFDTYFDESDVNLKYYENRIVFDKTLHQFVGGVSTFSRPGVMGGIERTFNTIGGLLLTYGVGDPEEIEEILKFNLGDTVSSTLGLDDMLDGYLAATQLKGDDLKAALEMYCPDYRNATDKDTWIANNGDKIKQLKANLGVMHFANSANTEDSELLLGNVMNSMDSIVDAVDNMTDLNFTPGDVWTYYKSTPRGKAILDKYNGNEASAQLDPDYSSFMTKTDDMLGLTGTELAVLSKAVGNGTENEAGINTLGALYALSAGYFNNPDYYKGNQGDEITIGTFPAVVDALRDPGFKDYYEDLGEADIAAYLEQMRALSKNENLDLTKDDVFTGVFTGGSN